MLVQIEYAHLPLNNNTLELVEKEIADIIARLSSAPEWEADAERLDYLLGVRYAMEECLSRITDAGIRN